MFEKVKDVAKDPEVRNAVKSIATAIMIGVVINVAVAGASYGLHKGFERVFGKDEIAKAMPIEDKN